MSRTDAFRLTFAVLLAAQALAYGWFLLPSARDHGSVTA